MKSVLVKIPFGVSDDPLDWGYTNELKELRTWCYKNTRFPWCTYELSGDERSVQRFIIFEFNNNKEAMKFKLYAGT